MCDEWARKDSRIRVIHKQNGGLSDARNAGMKISNGEYISFVDSDDWIENKFIEKLYKGLVEFDCDFSGCKFRKVKNHCEIVYREAEFQAEVYDTTRGLRALIDEKICQVVWNKLYKRTLIENIEFEKGKCHEDEFWSYQVFAKCKKYVEIDYVGYNYFQRETSIMGEKYSLRRLDAIEAKICRQCFLEEYFPELSLQARVNLLFSCMAQGQAAVSKLKADEKRYVFDTLNRTIKKYKIIKAEYKGMKLTHRVWLILANYSLEMVCKTRNLLHVGE